MPAPAKHATKQMKKVAHGDGFHVGMGLTVAVHGVTVFWGGR